MTTAALRKKLVAYVQTADEEKVKAIYTIMADEINTAVNDLDADFVKELNNRSKDFKKGTTKSYTWEATKKAAVDKLKRYPQENN